jgi:hypothetical protein
MTCHFMPFVSCACEEYVLVKTEKETTMNWVFETYSNVYNTAMMQNPKIERDIASAKSTPKVRGTFARLFSR